MNSTDLSKWHQYNKAMHAYAGTSLAILAWEISQNSIELLLCMQECRTGHSTSTALHTGWFREESCVSTIKLAKP